TGALSASSTSLTGASRGGGRNGDVSMRCRGGGGGGGARDPAGWSPWRAPPGPPPRLQLVLAAPHHDVGAGLAVLEDRVLEAALPLVDRAEVEVDLRVVLGQLERLQDRQLRVLEPVQLQVDEAEVVEERVGLGALRGQLAV